MAGLATFHSYPKGYSIAYLVPISLTFLGQYFAHLDPLGPENTKCFEAKYQFFEGELWCDFFKNNLAYMKLSARDIVPCHTTYLSIFGHHHTI